MDDTKFATEIEDALNHEFKPKTNTAPAPVVKPRDWATVAPPKATQAPSLAEDWETHLAIGAALKDRLRKAKAKLLTEHDRQWLDLRHRYEERISNTIADMRAELEAEQRRMVEAYQAKTRELDLLTQRVEEDGA